MGNDIRDDSKFDIDKNLFLQSIVAIVGSNPVKPIMGAFVSSKVRKAPKALGYINT